MCHYERTWFFVLSVSRPYYWLHTSNYLAQWSSHSWDADSWSATQESLWLSWSQRVFNAAFTRTCHWPVTWGCESWPQSLPASLRAIFILFSYLCLSQMISSLQIFLPKFYLHFSVYPSWFHRPVISDKKYKFWKSMLCSFTHPTHVPSVLFSSNTVIFFFFP